MQKVDFERGGGGGRQMQWVSKTRQGCSITSTFLALTLPATTAPDAPPVSSGIECHSVRRHTYASCTVADTRMLRRSPARRL